MKKISCKNILVMAALLTASAVATADTYIQQDSITRNKQDFAYLVAYTEANYAAFPAIMEGTEKGKGL